MSILLLNRILLLLFMISAVCQDLKMKSVSVKSFLLFGGLIFLMACLSGVFLQTGWLARAGSMGIGAALIMISRLSRGAIGEGDGWFLIITGILLGFWNNLALLLYGILFCSCYSLGLVVWGFFLKVNIRKKTVPFLPFLLPFGIWMVFL